MQPEGSAMVQCVGHTSEAKFYPRHHALTASYHQTAAGHDSAADEDDEDGLHGNTTSTATYRRCHGY